MKKNSILNVVLISSIVFVVGCAPAAMQASSSGLSYPSSGLMLKGTGQESAPYVGEDWLLEEFGKGVNVARKLSRVNAQFKSVLLAKLPGRFHSQGAEPYDLVLRHSGSDSRIWIKSKPVSQAEFRIELPALIDEYVHNLSGVRKEVLQTLTDVVILSEHRYGAVLESTETVHLGHLEALLATIQIVDLDLAEANVEHRVGRLKVFVAKVPDFMVTNDWDAYEYGYKETKHPGLLLAGYFSTQPYFDDLLVSFYQLLSQFSMGDNALPLTWPTSTIETPAAPAPLHAQLEMADAVQETPLIVVKEVDSPKTESSQSQDSESGASLDAPKDNE